MQRVVITGMGIYSCIGKNLTEVRDSLFQGRSGIVLDPVRKAFGYRSGLTGFVERPNLKGLLDRRARILLADVGRGEQIGLLVDEVQQVWRLAAEEIEPANALGGEQPAHIAGIGRPAGEDGTILILLDLHPILDSP